MQVCQPTEGGVAHQVAALAKSHAERGYHVEVACPEEGGLARELREAGIGVRPVTLVREPSPRADLSALLRLRRIVKEGGFDLVHAHSAKGGALGRIAARLAGVRAVYSPHAWSFLAAGSRPMRFAYLTVERVLAHAATSRIICVSTAELELGREALGPRVREKLGLIPNGVAIPEDVSSAVEARMRMRASEDGQGRARTQAARAHRSSHPASRRGGTLVRGARTERDAAKPLPSDADAPLVVGTVARLSNQKGIKTLVEAAEIVFDELGRGGPDGPKAPPHGVRFVVAGDGPLKGEIVEDVRRRGLRGRFELAGAVPAPWEFLKGLDVFVLPSLYEGDAFALKEAMGAGLPVSATDVGGVRDAIPESDYGRVVPAGDPQALAGAILWFLAQPRRRELCGRNARRRVEERFSLRRMVLETENHYAEVLAG